MPPFIMVSVYKLCRKVLRKMTRGSVKTRTLTFMLPCIVIDFFLNNQPDALIIQIYSVTKPYMFRASPLPIVRSFLLYVQHW